MLSAHMDTVDPGRGIKPMLDADGETLRSDGTTILGGDCKAGIAIVLEGLTSAIEAGGPMRPVQVVFSRAEEGGLNGARNLDFSLVHAKDGIVFDGEGPVSRICVGAPAQNIVQANISGVAAHAGLEPENGVSALLVAANILTRLPWAASTTRPPAISACYRGASNAISFPNTLIWTANCALATRPSWRITPRNFNAHSTWWPPCTRRPASTWIYATSTRLTASPKSIPR